MQIADKVNILLVDDKPENLLVLEAIIACEEYNLIKAFSGEEALKYLLKLNFAVILLDVQMPVLDGFSTVKLIKARKRTRNTPIIFITANYMDSKHVLTGYSVGAMDYILKPFDPIVLKSKVRGYVEIFKLNRKLDCQAEMLSEKTKQLEKTCAELYQTTNDLLVSEALANVISETAIDSMLIMDNNGCILKANPAVSTMFQYQKQEILNKNITELFSSEEALTFIDRVMEMANNNEDKSNLGYLEDVIALRKDGTNFPAELQIGLKIIQSKCVIACTIRDVSKKKRAEEIIRNMAYYDNLTNLPNRRKFNDQLNTVFESARMNGGNFAVMLLDIDRFKYINEALGYELGDQLIIQITRRLKEFLSDSIFISRYSGDQFGIIVEDLGAVKEYEGIAGSIIELFSQTFKLGIYELDVTLSIGVFIYNEDVQDADSLVKHANTALLWAKHEGKNRYKFYSSDINIQSYKQFELRNDLRKAVKNSQFRIYYQPLVNLKNSKILAAEALIRWEHPEWGLVSPDEFISLAEEMGIIIDLGYWILREVCSHYKQWLNKGLPEIKVSVNISGIQFFESNFVENIKNTIDEFGLDPHFLIMEITESTLMEQANKVISDIEKLQSIGIQIALDDFGTGFSALSYLSSLNINIIKINGCFISDIDQNIKSTVITRTIINMARELNIKTGCRGNRKLGAIDISAEPELLCRTRIYLQ